VINISDVTYVFQLITKKTQAACYHIKGHKGTAMTDMTQIVNGDTTHVHAHFTGMDRFEFLFLARQGIKNFKHRRFRLDVCGEYLSYHNHISAAKQHPLQGDRTSGLCYKRRLSLTLAGSTRLTKQNRMQQWLLSTLITAIS